MNNPGIHMPSVYDRRITELVEESHAHDVLGKTAHKFISDPFRSATLQQYATSNATGIKYGVIVYSVPYCNWYKVQVEGTVGTIGCTALTHSSNIPMGVRQTNLYPAYTQVLLHILPGNTDGIILGAIPDRNSGSQKLRPDWISQDGNTGLKHELCYNLPFRGLLQSGGIVDRSANRPLDSTSLDWGHISSTGIGIHIDDFQTFLRVNEMCGLFLNYFDSYAKLSGINLDIVSSGHEMSSRNDEGELQLFEGYAMYPWEAIGDMAGNNSPFASSDDFEVQNNTARGKYDLRQDLEDVQPFYRHRKWAGYLGQGSRQQIVVPASQTGHHTYGTDEETQPDIGAIDEAMLMDGSYLLRASRQIILQKTSIIPVAKRTLLPEDQSTDPDDVDVPANDNKLNYAFSGIEPAEDSEISEHLVGDIEYSEADGRRLLQRNASLHDIVAHTVWKADLPFHHHEHDFESPDASDYRKSGITRAQDRIDLASDIGSETVTMPSATPVGIDHRYEEVDYFSRTATFALTEDGGFVLECGYGSQILASGGNLRLSCPGNIELLSGRSLRTMGSDVVIKAHDSVDVSASNQDVRIKAENNLQIVAGNSGQGGVLIESKATSSIQRYDNRVGEDVRSSGITLKSDNSDVVCYSKSMYFRTGQGGNPLGSGDIVFDASRGSRDVIVKSRSLRTFVARSVDHFFGPGAEDSNVRSVTQFTADSVSLGAATSINGNMIATGSLVAGGSCQIGGTYAGGQTQDIIPGSPGASSVTSSIRQRASSQRQSGRQQHSATILEGHYGENRRGNSDLINSVGFSFRDDPEGDQYNVRRFEFLEPRWQQMSRLGEATGGSPWRENPVQYQQRDLMPWPGNKHWTGETLLQLDELVMYDSQAGHAKDKGEDYENPVCATFTAVPFEDNYKIIN